MLIPRSYIPPGHDLPVLGLLPHLGVSGRFWARVIVPILVQRDGPAAAFQVGAGGFMIAALLVLVLGVETRGKILENVSH